MATYTRTLERGRWVGTMRTFAQAVLAGEDTLRKWLGGQAPEFHMHAELAGQEVSSDNPNDLTPIVDRNPRDISEVSVRLGGWSGPNTVELTVRSSILSSLRVKVEGTDEERVRGLMGKLQDLLESGQRAPRRYERWYAFFAGAIATGWGGVGLILAIKSHSGTVPAFAALTGVGLFTLLMGLLTPGLELLSEGGKSRLARFRGGVIAFALAVAAGIVASLIYSP
jgi:hypothetical protein